MTDQEIEEFVQTLDKKVIDHIIKGERMKMGRKGGLHRSAWTAEQRAAFGEMLTKARAEKRNK